MMQKVYEPENLMEAELLQGMLASEGIEAHVTGRHLLGGLGELPALGLLGVSVDNDDVERARELITAYNAALPFFSEEPGSEPDNFPDVLVC
ncbi:Uncharacterised protein [Paucimonas lemoignei]|nr:Uncharacterised protein [Paucimonas lemoignei]